MAFLEVGIELLFEGLNENEIAKVVSCKGKHMLPIGQVVLKVNTDYYRPTEVELLIGDASKAYNKLGWKPTYTLLEIVKEMVASDLILFQKKQVLKDKGFNVENNFE